MAWYKYERFLKRSSADAYDKVMTPGQSTPYSGIYRCEGCGREVASNSGNPLPPQNHHQHLAVQGQVRWRLVVYADHDAS